MKSLSTGNKNIYNNIIKVLYKGNFINIIFLMLFLFFLLPYLCVDVTLISEYDDYIINNFKSIKSMIMIANDKYLHDFIICESLIVLPAIIVSVVMFLERSFKLYICSLKIILCKDHAPINKKIQDNGNLLTLPQYIIVLLFLLLLIYMLTLFEYGLTKYNFANIIFKYEILIVAFFTFLSHTISLLLSLIIVESFAYIYNFKKK